MDPKKEYLDIISAAEARLELLSLSGIYDIPSHGEARVGACEGCALVGGKAHAVRGEGGAGSRLMFVGGAPDEAARASGRPFSGSEAELLAKIINAMGFDRRDVYVTCALKCAPGESESSLAEGLTSCRPFLVREISVNSPRVIVALGESAASAFLGKAPFDDVRGRFHSYGEILLMPTYDPATLLERPELKKDVWKDMRRVAAELKKAPPD